MQTKLTEQQISNCRNIIYLLDKGDLSFVWWNTEEGSDYWVEVVTKLREKIHEGTSDGKPYIEPEPVIPEGYRKALDNEHCRKDVKLWDEYKKQWSERRFPCQPFLNGNRYIVPIDPPLTDEDACVWPRLLVMVRDNDKQKWEGPFQYVGKDTASGCSLTHMVWGTNGYQEWHEQARRATPEEIEAAK